MYSNEFASELIKKPSDYPEDSNLIQWAARKLDGVSSSARLDAEILLLHVLQIGRSALYGAGNRLQLTAQQRRVFHRYLQRRQMGEPIAYIVGYREFWDVKLFVNRHTLIPRPETELLVEIIVQQFSDRVACKIVDLGTGCGAIALAIAKQCPQWQVYATDISELALEVAQRNANQLQLQAVYFLRSDWCADLSEHTFDIIVSNPPYVGAEEVHWCCGDLRFEPKMALTAGRDGLQALRKIVSQAKNCLPSGGWLFLEHGACQMESVCSLLQKAGYRSIMSFRDLSGQFRVSRGQYVHK